MQLDWDFTGGMSAISGISLDAAATYCLNSSLEGEGGERMGLVPVLRRT